MACTPVRFRAQRANGDAWREGLAAAAPLEASGSRISVGPLDDREAVAEVAALPGPLSEWTLGMPQLVCGGQDVPQRGSQVGGNADPNEFNQVRPVDPEGGRNRGIERQARGAPGRTAMRSQSYLEQTFLSNSMITMYQPPTSQVPPP